MSVIKSMAINLLETEKRIIKTATIEDLKQNKKVQELLNVIKFYADKGNWYKNPDYSFERDVIDTEDTDVTGSELHEGSKKVLEIHSGGRRARQALKEWE